ncbi:relaxase/mobilization nuclease domain-containing protein [Pontibacter litorisediminis]|uniref:relaxase/mobilization nuclease domain-containing protein n=1 Tax=Pontibacter litorisediminis TaxID=1846260 RepID=UPI0023ED13F3|nr:relaxase/mobilization nuclease domain-containing protein [Pontibacter litorisediminis]
MSKSIAASVTYVVGKPEARILAADGLRTDSVAHMIRDFSLVSKLNPELENKVGHISLSWSRKDREKLSPEVLVTRAREYLERMGIRNTQHLIVEHRDTQHPHVHILYNKVSYAGRVIEADFQLPRSMRVISEMIARYGYHLHAGKDAVNRQRLNPSESARFALYDALRPLLGEAKSWEELRARLQRQGITLRFKLDSGTGKVLGVSFKKGNYSFKGSAIDPGLSYSSISRQLEHNLQARLQRLRAGVGRQAFPDQQQALAQAVQKEKGQINGLQPERRADARQAEAQKQETRQALNRNLWKW